MTESQKTRAWDALKHAAVAQLKNNKLKNVAREMILLISGIEDLINQYDIKKAQQNDKH